LARAGRARKVRNTLKATDLPVSGTLASLLGSASRQLIARGRVIFSPAIPKTSLIRFDQLASGILATLDQRGKLDSANLAFLV
jgi:hypothetical protein